MSCARFNHRILTTTCYKVAPFPALQSVVLPVVNLMCEYNFCAECLRTFWIVNFLLITVGGGLVTYIDVWWQLKAIPPWWQRVVKMSLFLRFFKWSTIPGMRRSLLPCRFSTMRFSQNPRVTGKSSSLFLLRERISSFCSLPAEGGNFLSPVLSITSFLRL